MRSAQEIFSFAARCVHSVRLESLTYESVRLESLTYECVRLESLTYECVH